MISHPRRRRVEHPPEGPIHHISAVGSVTIPLQRSIIQPEGPVLVSVNLITRVEGSLKVNGALIDHLERSSGSRAHSGCPTERCIVGHKR